MAPDEEESLRSLVGYTRRLHKMSRKDLLAEAERVGLSPYLEGWRPADAPREAVIRRILECQGLTDEEWDT